MKTVLVSGSAGFIGRHFAAALEDRGYEVDRCDPAHPELFLGRGGYIWNNDCRGIFASVPIDGCAPFYYDIVIHCAAMVDGREAIDGKPALLGAYNLQLDGALFEWALRAKPGRIVYFSSSAVYPTVLQGGGARVRLAEAHVDTYPAMPDQTYGWVKLTGERIAAEVRKAGVPVTVVRPFSGYGEDQDDCYPFPAMIARAKRRDDPFVVWGDGQQVRDFIHVDDIVAATLALVDAGVDGPVNLGTGVGTSMDELAEIVMRTAGYDAPIEHLADKPSGVQHRVADPSVLLEHYQPRVSLEEGVARALAYESRETLLGS